MELMCEVTEREKLMSSMLAKGFTIEEIAQHLGLHSNSIQHYVMKLRDKLGAKTNVQAAIILYDMDLI